MLFLSEKRALEAAHNYLSGALFMCLNTPGCTNTILGGYVQDMQAMASVALQESNPAINKTSFDEYLKLVANSHHVPSAELAERVRNVIAATD